MKRILAGVATTALALGGVIVATAAPASAHTPITHATCDTLTVDLRAYKDGERAGKFNSVTVAVDGTPVLETTFGASYYNDEIDIAGSSTWTVDVDAWDSSRYDAHESGTTEPCPPTTPEEPESSEVQVGIYLYPKLDKDEPAAWENSGEQQLLDTTTLTLPEDELKSGQHWYTELPATDVLDDIDLCFGWGIQQDLVRGGPDEYPMPESITYPDGSSMDGHLVDWTHQELSDLGIELPTAEDCATPPTPPTEPEPEVVVPVAPAAVTVCGATSSDVELPAATEEITYVSTEQGVLAVPTAGHVFGDELAGYTLTEAGEALFPIEALVPTAEDCALIPGDIAAVCQDETPYLGYSVSLPEGIEVDDENPLTITFLNPDGENHVTTDLPLEGSLLWPGASDTAPLQWPGWELQEDGSYVETDGNYAWTRDGVQVLFEVNPSYAAVVDYPPASSECANPQGVGGPDVDDVAVDVEDTTVTAESGDELAMTGATVGWVAGFAALLVAGGVTLFLVRRRLAQR